MSSFPIDRVHVKTLPGVGNALSLAPTVRDRGVRVHAALPDLQLQHGPTLLRGNAGPDHTMVLTKTNPFPSDARNPQVSPGRFKEDVFPKRIIKFPPPGWYVLPRGADLRSAPNIKPGGGVDEGPPLTPTRIHYGASLLCGNVDLCDWMVLEGGGGGILAQPITQIRGWGLPGTPTHPPPGSTIRNGLSTLVGEYGFFEES